MKIILALAITLAIEANLFMILDFKNFKLFLLVSLINIVTNTSMNVALMYFIPGEAYYYVLAAFEIGVVFIEALFVKLFLKYKYTHCLLFSLIANATSFLVGLLVNQVIKTNVAIIAATIIFTVIYFVGFTVFIWIYSKEVFKEK